MRCVYNALRAHTSVHRIRQAHKAHTNDFLMKTQQIIFSNGSKSKKHDVMRISKEVDLRGSHG
jgi:hypothetical protein